MNEHEEKICDSLIAFVDFIYAVVFGLIVAELFEEVIFDATRSFVDRSSNVLLVIGVFYFLTWDWLHGRLLTIRNPYGRYRRFFVEILIAFCGYGATVQAIQVNFMSMLAFIGLVLVLGSLWARYIIAEYPESYDHPELVTIQTYQLRLFAIGVGTLWMVRPLTKALPQFAVSLSLVVIGWLFVLSYELFLERRSGIAAGPGVPYLTREQLNRLAVFMRKNLNK